MKIKVKVKDEKPKVLNSANPSESEEVFSDYTKVARNLTEKYLKEDDLEQVQELDLLGNEVSETIEVAKVKKTPKYVVPLRNILLVLVVLTSFSAVYTFSRYITTVNTAPSQAVVAKFDVNVLTSNGLSVNGGTETISFSGYFESKDYLGDRIQKTYNYTVQNNGEVPVNAVCNVSGSFKHKVSVYPSIIEIEPGSTSDFTVTIMPDPTASNDESIILSFDIVQVD